MYYMMFFLGFIFLLIYNWFFWGYYNTTRKRAMYYTLTFAYGMLGAALMGKIYTSFCEIIGINDNSRLAIFGAVVFAPILIILSVIIEKAVRKRKKKRKIALHNNKKKLIKTETISVRDTLDLLTPGLFITIACGKIGCSIEGCCYGVECVWGVHSERAGTTVFPVQLFEASSLIILLIICYFIKRTRFFRRGMAYPLTATFYSATRFFWEYLRYYPAEMRHIMFGLTFWQFCCIIVFTASVISLIILYKTQPSEPLPKWKNTKKRA